jgi:hypothetical protein
MCTTTTADYLIQVDLALSIEQKLPTALRRFFIRGEYTVVPNRKRSFKERLQQKAFGTEKSHYDSPEKLSNALHPQPVSVNHGIIADGATMPAWRGENDVQRTNEQFPTFTIKRSIYPLRWWYSNMLAALAKLLTLKNSEP